MVYLCHVSCNVLSTEMQIRFLKSGECSLFWFWPFHTSLVQGHFRLAISFRLSSDTRLPHPIYFGIWWDSLNPTILFLMWKTGCLLDSGARAMWSSLPAAACATAEMLLMLPPGWMKPQHPWKLVILLARPYNRRSKNTTTGVELPHSDRYWDWLAFLIQGWSWS